MNRKIVLVILIIFTSFNGFSQDTIKGKMKPVKDYSWVILYQLKGVHQKYIANATVADGKFELIIPKGNESGMYRILYDNKKNMYLDFIYNHENVSLEFHPDYPSVLVKFMQSDENKLYQNYLDDITDGFNQLDSVQVNYFQSKMDSIDKNLQNFYHKKLIEVQLKQINYENLSNTKLANHFIRANNRYYAKNLIKQTNQYLDTLRSHYFDYIDFEDTKLEKSSFFMDRIIDYITYLHTSNDVTQTNTLQKKAIDNVLSKIKRVDLKKDVMESLLFMYAQQENKEIVDFIFKDYYNKLPKQLQDMEFKLMIQDFFKTAIGQMAPQISWDVYGEKYDLYSLPKKDYYVVLFWSSSCSHCLKEVPLFNAYLKDKKNISTLAIGLESKESQDNWKELTFDFENIKYHILGLGKWKSTYSQDYGVTGTPSYYILDENKKIIAKPYDFKALKNFFDKEKSKKGVNKE